MKFTLIDWFNFTKYSTITFDNKWFEGKKKLYIKRIRELKLRFPLSLKTLTSTKGRSTNMWKQGRKILDMQLSKYFSVHRSHFLSYVIDMVFIANQNGEMKKHMTNSFLWIMERDLVICILKALALQEKGEEAR